MRNEDGYKLIATVIKSITVDERFVTMNTELGNFSLLKDWFTIIPTQGTAIIVCIRGFNEVAGVIAGETKNFYVKPDEYVRYTNCLLGKE